MKLFSMTKTLVLSFLISTSLWADPSVASVEGLWKTQDGRAKIDIKPCPDAPDQLCGTIVELREPLDPYTKEDKHDQLNPDETLRKRKLLGLMNLMGFKAVADEPGRWTGGTIYSPREGKTYSSEIEISADGKSLDVRGYVGLPIFGQSQIWTRTTSEEKLTTSH